AAAYRGTRGIEGTAITPVDGRGEIVAVPMTCVRVGKSGNWPLEELAHHGVYRRWNTTKLVGVSHRHGRIKRQARAVGGHDDVQGKAALLCVRVSAAHCEVPARAADGAACGDIIAPVDQRTEVGGRAERVVFVEARDRAVKGRAFRKAEGVRA